jgi:hypothetical protein
MAGQNSRLLTVPGRAVLWHPHPPGIVAAIWPIILWVSVMLMLSSIRQGLNYAN